MTKAVRKRRGDFLKSRSQNRNLAGVSAFRGGIPYSLLAIALIFASFLQVKAEELLFGSSDHLSAIIDELSPANKLLYTDNHLQGIVEPTRLYYEFQRRSQLEAAIDGRVTVNIVKIHPTGRKDMTFRFLKGREKVRFPPQVNMTGNPVFMLFLERDAREMHRYTGGNALYFRSRLRHALASAPVKPVTFDFEGHKVDGQEIRIHPFQEADLADRFPRYRDKEYVFLFSDTVPGKIYQIQALTPSQSGDDWFSKETLTFQSVSDE